MRDFFIGLLDKLIAVIVVLMVIFVLIASVAMMTGAGNMMGPGGAQMGGGPVAGIIFLIVGLLYVAFVAGFLYLGLGIYHNTRRTAEALESGRR